MHTTQYSGLFVVSSYNFEALVGFYTSVLILHVFSLQNPQYMLVTCACLYFALISISKQNDPQWSKMFCKCLQLTIIQNLQTEGCTNERVVCSS